MVENVVVVIIVGTVLALAGRSFCRTLTGKSDGCRCGSGGCGMSGSRMRSCGGVEEQREGTAQYVEPSKEMRR